MEAGKVNPYGLFEVDKEAENEVGIWAKYPVKGFPEKETRIRFVHSGQTNPKYRDALRAVLKPLKFRIDQDLVNDEEYESLKMPVYAKHIIKEWQVKDENGNFVPGIYGDDFAILPVTVENMLSAWGKGIRLFRDIDAQASQFATFKKQELDEQVKK